MGVPAWGRENPSPACCWGGWNGKPKDGAARLIRSNACGHKLNLQDAATVQAYKEIWTA